MMTDYNLSDLVKTLGPEDFEEAELLDRWSQCMKRAESLRIAFGKVDKNALAKCVSEAQTLTSRLGYNPESGRPARPRGRIRSNAMPKPLPAAGTELLSCLDEVYVVLGYAQTPRSTSTNLIVYRDPHGHTIVRSTAHMFAGSLNNDVPFVTWDDDPRKLKPHVAVPVNKRRSMSKRDLADSAHADPEAAGNWVKPAGRY